MSNSKKRYEVHDSLGYIRSYTSIRRAEQAIGDMGQSILNGLYFIKDKLDKKAKSIIKLKDM